MIYPWLRASGACQRPLCPRSAPQRPTACCRRAPQAVLVLWLILLGGLCLPILPHVPRDVGGASPWTGVGEPRANARRAAQSFCAALRGGSADALSADPPGQATPHNTVQHRAAAEASPGAPASGLSWMLTHRAMAIAALMEPALATPRHWPPGAKAATVAAHHAMQMQQAQHVHVQSSWTQKDSEAEFLFRMQQHQLEQRGLDGGANVGGANVEHRLGNSARPNRCC